MKEHAWSSALLTQKNALARIDELATQGFDVFVNLCDGEPGEDVVGIEVMQHLERLGLPFTGCGSRFYGSTRRSLKQAYSDAGIGTPRYGFVKSAKEALGVAEGMCFPLIVKPGHGYASIGIERDSVVTSPAELGPRVERTIARFGEALLEEFIQGREFTVLAAEPVEEGGTPVVYQPLEVCFAANETFKHFELKWKDYENMALRPSSDPAITEKLRRLGAQTFAAVGASGYVRLDVRVDRDGHPYVLDCNTNCGIFYAPESFGAADFILASEPDGHRNFLRHILRCALRRAHRPIPPELSLAPSVPLPPDSQRA
jgi:D-alanine-D-alanine ligase